MFDPVSIGVLVAGIKGAADVVRKGIELKKDASTLTSALADLFDIKGEISKKKRRAKKSPIVSNKEVMQIVMAEKQAQETLEQLKNELYWGRRDGADIWKAFWELRAKMIREREEAERRRIARNQKIKDRIILTISIVGIMLIGLGSVWFLIDFMFDYGRKAGKW